MLRSPLPPLALNSSPHLLHHHHCPSPLSPQPLPTPSLDHCGPATASLTPRYLAHKPCRKRSFTPSSPLSFTPSESNRLTTSADNTAQDHIRSSKRVRFNSHGQNVVDRRSLSTHQSGVRETDCAPAQRQGVPPLNSAVLTSPSLPFANHSFTMDIDTALYTDPGMDDEFAKRPRMARVSSANSTSTIDSTISCNDEMPSIPSKSRTSSPSLPPRMHLKRPNLKKLSLALPSSSYSNSSSGSSTPTATSSTPVLFNNGDSSSHSSTPYTPGPPKTPALAMSLGRATQRGYTRPSLLSLITQPSLGNEVPHTPSGADQSYGLAMSARGKARARSYTAAEVYSRSDLDKGGARSAYPLSISTFSAFDGSGSSGGGFGDAMPITMSPQSESTSPNTSPTSSASGSTATTPSTSPPLPTAYTFSLPTSFPPRPAEPYEDGPIEVLPGVFLGAEDSVHHLGRWASGSSRVRVINVAQEVDDPFDPFTNPSAYGWSGNGKGKEKMKLATYVIGADRPQMEYCHVRWSHGELGLADVPESATLDDLLDPTIPSSEGIWRFWEAIRWMEEGRRADVPVLIHCQCGVSRSATLIIAYTMALAATGAMPSLLGHIRSMQDAYDFVKAKSSWIGPNHSLVFQLVDFARSLTSLLSEYNASPGTKSITTSFPSSSDAGVTEAEWARRRREFEESEDGSGSLSSSPSGSELDLVGMSMSPEEANDEAKRWDQAMLLRKEARR